MKGDVILFEAPEGFKSMPVDVYLYGPDRQTTKLQPGVSYPTLDAQAVGCLPKGTPFYKASEAVDLMKWLHDAERHGYSSKLL